MTRFVGSALIFAGSCLLIGSCLASVNWFICIQKSGVTACDKGLTTALAAWSGAANVALGIAVQGRRSPEP
jgi:hypothetical protein